MCEVKRSPPRRGHESKECDRPRKQKDDLWRGCLEMTIGKGAIVQIGGMGSESNTVYARMRPTMNTKEASEQLSVGAVVDALVGECWKRVAKGILEDRKRVERDEYPSAQQLLKLGAVWLLNETQYANGGRAEAHRCGVEDEATVPNWEDFTLRVHYAPGRYFAAYEVDWGKYCRGRVNGSVEATVAGETPQLRSQGLPDDIDGVIVHENPDVGYTVINKPGPLPLYATIHNQIEDVFSMFTQARQDTTSKYASIPLRGGMDTEMSGLLPIATKKSISGYIKTLMEHTKHKTIAAPNEEDPYFIQKTYKTLVCVKNYDMLDRLEKFQKNKTIITHYCCSKSPPPTKYVRNKPNSTGHVQCQLKITKVGFTLEQHDNKDTNKTKLLRAASVSSKYAKEISLCPTLAQSLWGGTSQDNTNKPEDVQYVTELQLQVIGTHYPHQIRGQLAALGCPIVGDSKYGGGVCEHRSKMHGWKRLAIQCCELSFMEPELRLQEPKTQQQGTKKPFQQIQATNNQNVTNNQDEKTNQQNKLKRVLVPSDRRAHFKLNTAWWSEYVARHSEMQ